MLEIVGHSIHKSHNRQWIRALVLMFVPFLQDSMLTKCRTHYNSLAMYKQYTISHDDATATRVKSTSIALMSGSGDHTERDSVHYLSLHSLEPMIVMLSPTCAHTCLSPTFTRIFFPAYQPLLPEVKVRASPSTLFPNISMETRSAFFSNSLPVMMLHCMLFTPFGAWPSGVAAAGLAFFFGRGLSSSSSSACSLSLPPAAAASAASSWSFFTLMNSSMKVVTTSLCSSK
mmetsp:Transcript_5263/g.10039  ORF Transcript_5263/g.10039 Transcript_5263/m.10039 type:complete len:230 (+) Transcript_5263:2141-2830(+)